MQGDVLFARLQEKFGKLVWRGTASFDLPMPLYRDVKLSRGARCSACGAFLEKVDEEHIPLSTVVYFLRNAGAGCNWKVCLPGSGLCPACWEALRAKSAPAPYADAPEVEPLYAMTESDGHFREAFGLVDDPLVGERRHDYA